jgi:hypothetical protein
LAIGKFDEVKVNKGLLLWFIYLRSELHGKMPLIAAEKGSGTNSQMARRVLRTIGS